MTAALMVRWWLWVQRRGRWLRDAGYHLDHAAEERAARWRGRIGRRWW